MDPLSDVISLLEPKNYFVGGFEAGAEWSVRFGAYDGIKCYAVTSGRCWLVLDGSADPLRLEQGDCVLLPHGLPFRVASDPALPADDWQRVLRCSGDGSLSKLNDSNGVTVLGGHFQLVRQQAEMMLRLLPPIVHLQSENDHQTLRWAFDRMGQELAESRPGNVLILQQLVSMILVQALRLHLDEGKGVGWLFALSDNQVGGAIAAMHREPARHWSVEKLASEVGMSRAGFAARFRQMVGEGPIEYLTHWRMLLAGRSLVRGEPISMIARSLGYESESAFSTAFKRVTGDTPRHHARSAAGAIVH